MNTPDPSSAARLRYRIDGPADAPVCVLGPSLGTALELWDPQVPELARDWQVLRYDLRGHGGSATPPGPYTVAELATDVLALLDGLGMDRVAYCGLSLGGAVGSWLALHHPRRISALVLCCTAAKFGEAQTWHDRAERVRTEGVEWLVGPSTERWFTSAFPARDPDEVERLAAMLRATDPEGYAGCCEALGDFDVRDRLRDLDVPTRVVAGDSDPATPVALMRELADGVRGADFVVVPEAAHLANVEQPAAVTGAIVEHLQRTHGEEGSEVETAVRRNGPADEAHRQDNHAAGMRVRRDVLGDEHVDRAVASRTSFNSDFQDLITRYAWGEVWTRPGLDRRTRSVVTLTALVGGGHFDELAFHIRAALRNGLGADEVKEVLLQTAIYCGVPAANSAFAVANRVLVEDGIVAPPR